MPACKQARSSDDVPLFLRGVSPEAGRPLPSGVSLPSRPLPGSWNDTFGATREESVSRDGGGGSRGGHGGASGGEWVLGRAANTWVSRGVGWEGVRGKGACSSKDVRFSICSSLKSREFSVIV